MTDIDWLWQKSERDGLASIGMVKTRKDNSAENFAVIRRIALNVLKKFSARMILNRKRRKCHYDADFMADVLLSVD